MPSVEQLQVNFAADQATAAAAALGKSANDAADGVTKLGVAVDTVDTTAKRAGPSIDSLLNKYDGSTKSANASEAANLRYAASIDTVNKSYQAGAITLDQSAKLISSLTATRDADLAKAQAAGAKIDGVNQSNAKSYTDVSTTSGNAGFAIRQLGVQSVQALSGIATGQPILTTFIQQGHQIVDVAFSTGTGFGVLAAGVKSAALAIGSFVTANPILTAFAAATTAVAGLSYEFNNQQSTLKTLQNELSATHANYSALADEATAAGRAVAATTDISRAEADASAKAIASSANFAGTQSQLQGLIVTASGLAKVFGTDIPTQAEFLSKALMDPGAAAQQLADKNFPAMSHALADNISSLEASGKSAQAFGVLLTALQGSATEATKNVTPLKEAWDALRESFTSTEGAGHSIVTELGGYFSDILTSTLKEVQGIIDALKSLKDWIDSNITPTVNKVIGAVGNAIPSGSAIAQSFGFGNTPTLTSSAGALGIMQLMPQTAANLHVDPTNPDANIYGGMALIQQLAGTYGAKNYNAIAGAYNGGPALYNSNPSATAGYQASVASADTSKLPVDVASRIQFWGDSLGLPQDLIDMGKRIASVESKGSQYGTAGNASVPSGITGLSGSTLPASLRDYNTMQPDASEMNASISSANDPQKIVDGALKSADALGNVSKSAKDAQDAIAKYQSGLAALAQLGITSGADFDKLTEALVKSQNALFNAVPAITNVERGLNLQITNQNALTDAWSKGIPAVDALTAKQEAEAQATAAGLKGTSLWSAAVADFTQKNLDLAAAQGKTNIEKNITDTKNATDAQLRINQAYDGTAQSLSHAQDYEKAYQDALVNHLTPGTDDFTNAVNRETSALDAAADASQKFQQEQASVSAVAGALSSAFDTVGNAITQAFIQGQGAAVKWGTVMQGVISQVIQQVLKLAVINPIINSLFGQNNGTLASAFDVLSGSGSSVGAGGVGSSGIGGISNLLGLGGLSDSLGLTNIGSSLGITGPNGILSSLGSGLNGILGTQLLGGLAGGQFGPVTAGLAAGGVGLPASLTIGSLLGGLGAGFGAGSLTNSLLGGNALGGNVGSGLGAGAGALLGSIFPGVGTLLGGVLGGALGGGVGGLFGPSKASPYTSEQITVNQDGTLGLGRTASQITDNSAEIKQAQSDIDTINTYLKAVGITITNTRNAASGFASEGAVFQVGTGGPAAAGDLTKVGSVDQGFNQLQFGSSDPMIQQFLSGKVFSSLQDLETQVGQFQQAQAAISDFLTNTAPALTKVGQSAGSLNQQLAQIANQYNDAITQAQNLIATGDASAAQTQELIAAEGQLAVARDTAVAAAQKAANDAYDQNLAALNARYYNAAGTVTGNDQFNLLGSLTAFDASAAQQRQQLSDQLVATYGDTVKQTAIYTNAMATLEQTLGEERLAIQTQYNNQIASQQAQAAATALAAQQAAAAQAAQVAAQQQAAADAAARAAQQAAQAEQQAAEQAAQAAQQLQGKATSGASSVVTSITSYLQKLQYGSDSPLSPTAQLNSARSQFNAVSSAAAGGDFKSIQELTTYADSFLQASKAVNGSGLAYAQDYSKVLDALKQFTNLTSDQLTASSMADITQTQTATLTDNLNQLKSVMSSLLLAVKQGNNKPASLTSSQAA